MSRFNANNKPPYWTGSYKQTGSTNEVGKFFEIQPVINMKRGDTLHMSFAYGDAENDAISFTFKPDPMTFAAMVLLDLEPNYTNTGGKNEKKMEINEVSK